MVFSPSKMISTKGNKSGTMPEFMEWNEKELAKQLVSKYYMHAIKHIIYRTI